LMPGIDGFEAVRAIRSDPRTAAIPVMMYTSQEGEAYHRQALAVGAAGVLPKTLMPTDVARSLYQLKLLPDRRDTRAPLTRPPPQAPPPQPTEAASTDLSELRRSLEASLEAAARRIGNELRSAIQIPPQLAETAPTRAKSPGGLIAALILFALVPTIICGALLWQSFATGKAQLDQANARLSIVVAEQQAQIEALRGELRKRALEDGAELPTSTRTEIVAVGYGEAPFTAERIDRLRKLFDRLQAEGFKGRVRVETFVGDFCLTREAAGFALAAPDFPQRRCDLIGNPFDDALTAGQRHPSDYAALIAAVQQMSRGALQVATLHGGRKPLIAYPPHSDQLTAGEWNRVAARNHRIEITAESASDAARPTQ